MFSYQGHALNVPFILFLFSLVVIGYTIYTDIDFNLAGHVLFINHRFHGQQKFDLQQLREWEEISYPIRGQRRRNLILFFDQERIVELSNKDQKERYETVYKHLKKEFPLIEVFNMTVMQEIKFNSVHGFLTTDFYSPANKYSQTSDVKNKIFSIEIFKMKIEGADRDQIAERLLEIKSKALGEHETIGRCKQIADLVIEI